MGPPYHVLRINAYLNFSLNITAMNLAITDKDKMVYYSSGCRGCNGGIGQNVGVKVQGRELVSFLGEKYGIDSIKKVKFIKIDTEGHDVNILKSLKMTTTFYDFDPIIWVEWFLQYKYGAKTKCTKESKDLFDSIQSIGYQIYKPKLPLTAVKDCSNQNYVRDLLLIKHKK